MTGKMLQEHDDHFIVDDGKGPLKIAKLHLHHGTVQKIRQHFAEGGEVEPEEDLGPQSPIAPLVDEESPLPHSDDPAAVLGAMPLGQPPTPGADGMISVSPNADARQYMAAIPRDAGAPVTFPGSPAATSTPAPAGAPPSSLGAPPSELAAGEAQELSGIRSRAKISEAEGAATAALAGNLAEQRAALNTQAQQQLASIQAKFDQTVNDIQSGKVDPDHWWNSRGIGGKISASIGLILGGIGAGLTHGPNYALQIIDKAIDRDLDAQKMELGKKENLLSSYLKQGYTLIAAHQMAKAGLTDVASAQLQKTAAQYSGQKSAADAQIASGQLRQQAAAMRQQATERELQIRQGQIGLQQQQATADAFRELMKGVQGGGGFDRRVLEMPAFDKFRERAVDLPDGSVAFAADKTEAAKAREGFATVSTLKSKLNRYSDLLKNGSPVSTDRGTAQELRSDILAEMGHLHGLNRLSDKDLELFQAQVPDLTDLVKPMAAQKLRGLGKSIDDRVWSLQQNYLSRPGAGRPNG